jgi:hypothetical protein
LSIRGCLKSPDSVKFGDYTRSFQLPNTWAESYARTLSVEISGLFKHPLSIYTVALHRFLRARKPGYDYEKHFGGAYYLFLRGIEPARPEFGVHRMKLRADFVEKLSTVFTP